jgi:pimeloyl-ACP methyl ester carboxylesterase
LSSIAVAACLILSGSPTLWTQSSESSLGTHGFAQSNDVKIHYVTMGEGPLVVMIHGFPDYWYTWRKQVPAIARNFQVMAIDQRGYNESDQPERVANYSMDKLVGDVKAVIEHFGRQQATIVGHDWGGAVAWSFAMTYPQMTERLIVLNLPHFNGLRRELANHPAQQAASAYARNFQTPGTGAQLTDEGLAFWVTDSDAKTNYVAAFKRCSFEGMLNYYKANYPREPYDQPAEALPPVKCPVLMIHGLKDSALLPGALNDTWNWIDNELMLVTLPSAGHFVQQDAAESVTRTIVSWLKLKTFPEDSASPEDSVSP